jgi:hypothetical protein
MIIKTEENLNPFLVMMQGMVFLACYSVNVCWISSKYYVLPMLHIGKKNTKVKSDFFLLHFRLASQSLHQWIVLKDCNV